MSFETSVILIFKSADYIQLNGRIVLFFSSPVKLKKVTLKVLELGR